VPDPTATLPADDAALRAALAHAEVPALLPAVAYVTGDLALLRDDLRPDLSVLMDPTAGLSPEQVAEGRDLAFRALVRWRDAGGVPAPRPTLDELRAMLTWASGGAAVDEYLELLREELAVDEDLRAPGWTVADVAPGRTFRVAVIGAGMSGIVAAHRLRQAGVEVVVLEKNDDVGGTWLENRYPGCRVDVSNLFYSYSFAQRDDWPQHFSTQEVLLDYFRDVADRLDLRPLIRFRTEVTALELDEPTMTWTLQLLGPDGHEDTLTVDAVVSAVGQLNRPKLPDIPGLERFAGPAFHSARWDHGVELAGRRVAVIGTGASAGQFIPEVATEAGELTIFQRTPAWFIPTPDYHADVPEQVAWLLRHVPGYAHWYRFWIFWRNVEGLMPAAVVDPAWDDGERSVSAINDFVREMLTEYLRAEFADRPDLLEAVVPDYPPFAKRFIRDNGIWAGTLKRDNVRLVTERIDEITAEGVRTGNGTLHPADVIIYGTGFQAADFLTPMKVVGRGGVELHERWGGDARAYLGITLPGYPNLFLLYGPNTNIVVNGSIIYFSECETTYLLGCVRLLLETGHRALDPRSEVHDAYNERVDAENLRMAWGVSSVSSWYKNATGRSAQNWPFSLLEYWAQTRRPNPEDFELL